MKREGRGLQDRLGALDRPEHLTFTTSRRDQSEQHADRGGLAGTVRADDLVDLGGHQLVQDTEGELSKASVSDQMSQMFVGSMFRRKPRMNGSPRDRDRLGRDRPGRDRS